MSASTRSRSRAGSRGGGRVPVIGIVIAAVVVLALVALAVTLLTGEDEQATPETVEVADVDVEGESLPQLPQGGDPAVGSPVPSLYGVSPVGGPVAIEPGGEPLLIVVGAHWCPHCQAELPRVVEWLQQGGAEGVEVVGLSTAADESAPNYPPSEWWEREGWDRPVLVDSDDQAGAEALGVSGYPFFVLVDADGAVAGRWAGEIGTEPLDAAIAALEG